MIAFCTPNTSQQIGQSYPCFSPYSLCSCANSAAAHSSAVSALGPWTRPIFCARVVSGKCSSLERPVRPPRRRPSSRGARLLSSTVVCVCVVFRRILRDRVKSFVPSDKLRERVKCACSAAASKPLLPPTFEDDADDTRP